MDAEIKAKWVEALRSEKYVQGRGCLRDLEQNFCCLGVLCDIVSPEKWVPDTYIGGYRIDDNSGVPPVEFIEPLGLEVSERDALWNMNDEGKSFSEIADYIDANL